MQKMNSILAGLALGLAVTTAQAAPVGDPLTSVFMNTCIKSLGKSSDDLPQRMQDMRAPVLSTETLGSAMGISWEKAWQIPSATVPNGYVVAMRETSCMAKASGYAGGPKLVAEFERLFGKQTLGLANGLLDSALIKALPDTEVRLHYKEMPKLDRDALIILILDKKSNSSAAIVTSLPAGSLQMLR